MINYKINSLVNRILAGFFSVFFISCDSEKKIPAEFAGLLLLNQAGSSYQELSEEYYSGGGTTIFSQSSHAFSQPAPNLSESDLARHIDGDKAFEARFVVSDPAPDHSGLGPVFNNRACADCHVRDGRGRPEEGTTQRFGLLMKLSIPGAADGEAPHALPFYGTQLQDNAIDGVAAEGKVNVSYTEISGTFSDGTVYTLKQPVYTIQDPYDTAIWNTYSSASGGIMQSPRVAPPVFGRGLLEAVKDSDIIANAEAQASDTADSVAGIIQYVPDPENGNTLKIGRFALKGENLSVRLQSAGAYNQDMGITSSIFPNQNCREAGEQPQCNQADGAEISDQALNDAVFYSQTLAVPARRNVEAANVKRGQQLFHSAGCAVCHVPSYTTGNHPDGIAALSGQKIRPYTDMLLHDMGEGLADNRPSFKASGRHWKTPALWGLGLTQTVNSYAGFLHDGRAATIEEAILWHGGEAENAKNNFKSMNSDQRRDLLDFLKSL